MEAMEVDPSPIEQGEREEEGSKLSVSSESLEASPSKKLKKHKHKKHKKKRYPSGTKMTKPAAVEMPVPPLKLKIKLGGETFATKSVSRSSVNEAILVEQDSSMQSTPVIEGTDVMGGTSITQYGDEVVGTDVMGDGGVFVASGKPITEEDDEEAWLEALEAGDLNEHGELKKEKDVNLLTARQKALLQVKEDSQDSTSWDPVAAGPAPTSELTEEMEQKRAVRAQRRRDQAQKKDMETKKQTIERLLKKQEVKTKAQKSGKLRKKDEQSPQIHYIDSIDGISLSYPEGMTYPLTAKTALPPPKPVSCGVEGCGNLKKYSCSKTGIPLCSLECYKRNLRLVTVATG